MDNMTSISDNRIMTLYILARQEYGAAVTGDQKQAIEQLKNSLSAEIRTPFQPYTG